MMAQRGTFWIGLAVGAALVGAPWACTDRLSSPAGFCTERPQSEVPSPDARRRAVVATAYCTINSYSATAVYVLGPDEPERVGAAGRTGDPLADRNLVYRNSNRGPGGARAPTGVQVAWEGDSALVIREPRAAVVRVAVARHYGVAIRYEPLPGPAP
jgi:hypothetical protein